MSQTDTTHSENASTSPAVDYGDVRDNVARCIVEILGVDPARVTPETVLLDLGAQSFDFADLVYRLEDLYKISLPRSLMVPDTHSVDVFARAIATELSLQPKAIPQPSA